MASQSAPRGLLEAPREAAGEQFALVEHEGRCKKVGGSSHRAGLQGGDWKSHIRVPYRGIRDFKKGSYAKGCSFRRRRKLQSKTFSAIPRYSKHSLLHLSAIESSKSNYG